MISVYRLLGQLGIVVALLAIPAALLDGAVAGFALWSALLMGGISAASVKQPATYFFVNAALCLAIGFGLAHYSRAAGPTAPTAESVTRFAAVLALPLAIAAACAAAGWWRRRAR